MSWRLLKDGEILTESTKYVCVYIYIGFPGGTNGKEPTCQWRRHKRHGFDLWVRKIPWRRLPGEYSSVLVWWSSWTEEPGRLQSTGSPRVRHHWSYLAHIYIYMYVYGFPGGSDNKESACNAGLEFNPWVRKNPWKRAWKPTPVFLPREFHGQRSLAGYTPWGHIYIWNTQIDYDIYIHTHIYEIHISINGINFSDVMYTKVGMEAPRCYWYLGLSLFWPTSPMAPMLKVILWSQDSHCSPSVMSTPGNRHKMHLALHEYP